MAKRKYLEGVVANCNKLNIRTEPSKDGGFTTIMGVVDNLTPILVMPLDGHPEWYKCKVSGLRGYCMCKFVALKMEEKVQEDVELDSPESDALDEKKVTPELEGE